MDSLVSEGGIQVSFHDMKGNSFRLSVLGITPLRDVQQMLVRWLGLSFPLYSATLTTPDGVVFSDFKSEPFKDAMNGKAYMVQGEITTDMYFVDKMFRRTRQSQS